PEYMPAGGPTPEIVIEGDNAMDLRPGEIERPGDQRHGLIGNEPERFLQRVQNGQQRALQVTVLGDDPGRLFGVPNGISFQTVLQRGPATPPSVGPESDRPLTAANRLFETIDRSALSTTPPARAGLHRRGSFILRCRLRAIWPSRSSERAMAN